jgi:hypothetical protein
MRSENQKDGENIVDDSSDNRLPFDDLPEEGEEWIFDDDRS